MPNNNDNSNKPDQKERTDKESDRKSEQKPKLDKFPRPPWQTLVFWLLILFAVPMMLFFFNVDSREKADELTASQFDEALEDKRIKKINLVKDPATGAHTLKGIYYHDGADEERSFTTEVVYTDNLDKMLRDAVYAPHDQEGQPVTRQVTTQSNIWRNLLVSVLPIVILILVLYFIFSRQLKNAGRGAMQFGKSQAKLIHPDSEKVTFDEVSGVDEAKEEVSEIVEFLKNKEKFQKLGGKIPKGVLMVGPPGTGKTLLARAIAGEAGVPFYSISGSDFVEMFVGVGASRVRNMFDEGKQNAPCILFIDELDAIGRSRFSGLGGGHDEREQTLNALLVEMDGFEPNSGIIVMSATNRPDVLDPALLRPGRFDRQVQFDLPDVKGRLGILEVHAKKVAVSPNVDMETIAKGTPGYSGAELENLINEAALHAALQSRNAIEMPDMEEARDKVRWGRERRSRQLDVRDRRISAFHEAGHTLIGLYRKYAPPLHKVTIVPRGNAYLGATMNLPETDRYTQTYQEMIDQIIVLMGGRVAEELVFGDFTSGAAMDIKQATNFVKKMVCEWGMSENIGPVNYGSREEPIFVGREISRTQDHSEQTAREIDQEMRRIIENCLKTARKTLSNHIDQLKLLGDTLLKRETMSAAEIRELLNMPGKKGETAEDVLTSEDTPATPPLLIRHEQEASEDNQTENTEAEGRNKEQESTPEAPDETKGNSGDDAVEDDNATASDKQQQQRDDES